MSSSLQIFLEWVTRYLLPFNAVEYCILLVTAIGRPAVLELWRLERIHTDPREISTAGCAHYNLRRGTAERDPGTVIKKVAHYKVSAGFVATAPEWGFQIRCESPGRSVSYLAAQAWHPLNLLPYQSFWILPVDSLNKRKQLASRTSLLSSDDVRVLLGSNCVPPDSLIELSCSYAIIYEPHSGACEEPGQPMPDDWIWPDYTDSIDN